LARTQVRIEPTTEEIKDTSATLSFLYTHPQTDECINKRVSLKYRWMATLSLDGDIIAGWRHYRWMATCHTFLEKSKSHSHSGLVAV